MRSDEPAPGPIARGLARMIGLLWLITASAFAASPGDEPKPKAVAADHPAAMTRGLELFKGGVRAILIDHCLKCHGGASTKGDFDLATREALLEDKGEGPAVIPGDSRSSRFYKMVAHLEKPRMPDKAPKLPDDAIQRIAAWIDAGAPYDRSLVDPSKTPAHAVVTPEDRQFWSFRPLDSSPPPGPEGPSPIDRFLLAKLQARGITPNPPGDRRTLIRRAAFDLTGLPPEPETVEAFVDDPGARGLRTGRRPAPGQPPTRRALGQALAGPRPVRREPRL